MFTRRTTWLCAAYALTYVGTESAVSGWVVTYMMRVHHVSSLMAGLSSAAFWAGMAVGRVVLGFVSETYGTGHSVVGYLICAAVLQLAIATIDHPVASTVMIAVFGGVCGPLFPCAAVHLCQLLPKDLHVAGISLVASIGQVGAAFIPFGLGALIQAHGVHIFPLIIFIQLLIAILLWLVFVKLSREL